MTPAPSTAGYSGTPLAQKLGHRDGQRILFIALPQSLHDLRVSRNFVEMREAGWQTFAGGDRSFDIIHGFTASRTELARAASSLRESVARDGAVWISWPKKASKVPTDVTEDALRELLLPTGLVDVKVAAVDHIWSGLKFMIRRELR